MQTDVTEKDIRKMGADMIAMIGLISSPVDMRLLSGTDPSPEGAQVLTGHRYCQALMEARHGREVVL
jgi:uncharacterized protein (DUF169 family)